MYRSSKHEQYKKHFINNSHNVITINGNKCAPDAGKCAGTARHTR